MIAVGKTDRGRIRESNQDQFTILRDDNCLFAVVCDGIGGHVGGGKASKAVISYIKEHFKNHPSFDDPQQITSYLKQIVRDANRYLYQIAEKNSQLKGMGTTLVGLLISSHGIFSVNVGDSRVYGLSQTQLTLLSEDHSYVNELLKLGKINESQAKVHPYRNMLTNALGIAESVLVDVKIVEEEYQSYLLCSDGLHGYVEHDDILNTLLTNQSATKKVESLIKQANAIGGFDNITIVLVADVNGDSL